MQTEFPDRNEVIGLLKGIGQDAQTMVRQEVALARSELRRDISKASKVGAEAGMGAVLAVLGALLLVLASVFGLVALFPALPLWASFLSIGLALALVGGFMLAAARRQFQSLDLAPKQTIQTLKDTARVLAPGG